MLLLKASQLESCLIDCSIQWRRKMILNGGARVVLVQPGSNMSAKSLGSLSRRLSEISGLDYWNGLLDWTTGLAFEPNLTTKN